MRIYNAGMFCDSSISRWLPIRGGRQNVLCAYADSKNGRVIRSTYTAMYLAMLGEWFEDGKGNYGVQAPTADGKGTEMLVYCAGNMNPQVLEGMAERTDAKRWLETNAHKGSRECAEWFATNCYGFHIFIDSGAFTAWVKDVPIDLDAYIAFCKDLEVRKMFGTEIVYAALDVICGSMNSPAPPAEGPEFEASSQKGWENYLYMKRHGIQSIPTFHQGDPWKWLDTLADDTDYIALSPRKVDTTIQEKAAWLNKCFQRIRERGQLPGHVAPGKTVLKTHGLGVSSQTLMEMYPWFSVDNTTWIHDGNSCYYRFFDGTRANTLAMTEYKNNTDWILDGIKNYKKVGKANLVYWFHEKCMAADSEIETYMTKHWAARGVKW